MMLREKPVPSCSLTEMLADIDAGSDAIYTGPGAHTLVELCDQSPYSEGTVRDKAREKVDDGKWVEVKVQRIVRATKKAYYPPAWVRKETYEDWEKGGGETRKLGEIANVQ
jgi:hypothetical protein